MKKNDWTLIGVIAVLALAIWGLNNLGRNTERAQVEVTVDGEFYGTFPLDDRDTQVIEINGTNTLTIRDGAADMTDADCPDKLCVHQKAISADGESIICLPNKVVVTVASQEEAEYDAVTN